MLRSTHTFKRFSLSMNIDIENFQKICLKIFNFRNEFDLIQNP
jgi:hypothetical protein